MNGQELLELVGQYSNNIYTKDLYRELLKMNQEAPDKLDYFAEQFAPTYIQSVEALSTSSYEIKPLYAMAMILNQGRDPIQCLGINDYPQICRISLESLPLYTPYIGMETQMPIETPVQDYNQTRTDATPAEISSLYSLLTSPASQMRPVSCFYYGKDVDISKIPPCGYKIHIAANNGQDYYNLLNNIIPVFNALDVPYKAFDPNVYFDLKNLNPNQDGKAVTVYPNKKFELIFSEKAFDDKYLKSHYSKSEVEAIKSVRGNFKQVRSLMFEDPAIGHVPYGDAQVGDSRTFVRYGRFTAQNINVDTLSPQDCEQVRQALVNANLIPGNEPLTSDLLSRYNLLNSKNQLKPNLIRTPYGTFEVDPKVLGKALPDYIGDNLTFDTVFQHSLKREEAFERGEISENDYVIEELTGIHSIPGYSTGMVCYEYGNQEKGSILNKFFHNQKSKEELQNALYEVKRNVLEASKYSPDSMSDVVYGDVNGKHFCAVPENMARYLDQILANNGLDTIKRMDMGISSPNLDVRYEDDAR